MVLDHKRGCPARNVTCTCGYDDRVDHLTATLHNEIMSNEIMQDRIKNLEKIEVAVKRLAYVVRKSVNSGPLSTDPTQEAEAWRQVRIALGEGYDERGNLVPVSADNGR